MRILRYGGALCSLAVIIAVLSTVPVLEMGLNDDWSYNFIALGFARTGHIVYNGWAAALLGLQAIWGGWLIRVFGFSFTLLRLSTLPFAAGCAWLLYGLGRRTGLGPPLAAFGALAVTLSPVFIPVAASFMTDVPGLFFWLVCWLCGLRAADAADERRASLWLLAAAAGGFAGGTIRHVVWIAPFLVVPTIAWLRRRERRFALAAAAVYIATGAAAAACLHWYKSQAGHELVPPLTAIFQGVVEPLRYMTLAALMAILPVLLLFCSGWKRWRKAPAALLAGTLAAGAFVGICLWWFDDDLLLGNMVTVNGFLTSGTEGLGDRPQVLGAPVLAVLGVAFCLAIGFTSAWLVEAWRRRDGLANLFVPLRRFLFLTLPSCALYVAAVILRYDQYGIVFDRYLLYVTPVLVVTLLWLYQSRVRSSPPLAIWTVLLVFAAYGVSATHDYIAEGRARLQAASQLMASGIPRTQISAGLEFDGWTQLETTGQIPPREVRDRDSRKFPLEEPYWFWRMTPVVDPRYLVVTSPVEGLRNSTFAPVPYGAWLPPFHRQILIQTMPDRLN